MNDELFHQQQNTQLRPRVANPSQLSMAATKLTACNGIVQENQEQKIDISAASVNILRVGTRKLGLFLAIPHTIAMIVFALVTRISKFIHSVNKTETSCPRIEILS